MKKYALIWTVLLLFPAFMLSAYLFNYSPGGYTGSFLCTGVCLISALAGCFFSDLNNKSTKHILYFLSVMFYAAAMIYQVHSGKPVFLPAVSAVMFIAGIRFARINFYNSVRSIILIAAMAAMSVVTPSLKKAGFIENYTGASVVIAADTFFYIFLRNRKNIYGMVKKRNYDPKYLPREMKKNNSLYASVLCAAAAASMILVTPAVFLSRKAAGAAKKIISLLETESETSTDIQQEAETVPSLITQAQPSVSRIILYLIIAFSVIFLIAAVYFNRDIIYSAIVKKISDLRKKIAKLLKSKKKPRISAAPEDIGFSDTIEYIEDTEYSQDTFFRSSRRTDRKLADVYREFLSMPENNSKFRTGYRLLISLLKRSGNEITKSDTPDETAQRVDEEDFYHITEKYDSIRYGCKNCSGDDISQMKTVVSDHMKRSGIRIK